METAASIAPGNSGQYRGFAALGAQRAFARKACSARKPRGSGPDLLEDMEVPVARSGEGLNVVDRHRRQVQNLSGSGGQELFRV